MPRSVARIAAIAAFTVGSGAVVAVPPALADIGADMRFACTGGTGTHAVGLRVESNVPSSATVGQPVQLGTIRVGVDIPAELADEVRAKSPGAASTPPKAAGLAPSPAIGGVAEVPVTIREPGRDRRGGWPAFALAAMPTRGDGTVHLTGSGVAPPVVPAGPGGLSWVVRELNLSLVPDGATTRTERAALSLHCVAEKGTTLGTVAVRQGSQALVPNSPTEIPGQAEGPQEQLCEEIPPPGSDPRYAINSDPALMKIFDEPQIPDGMSRSETAGIAYCIKAVGFVNLKKAGNAVPIAAESLLRRGTVQYRAIDPFSGPNYLEQRGYTVNRTYPAPGTLLGFGFMPTRAVAETVQVGAPGAGPNDPITGNLQMFLLRDQTSPVDVLEDTGIEAATYVHIKANTAEVNGIPINLGDKCMTGSTRLFASAFLGNDQTGLLVPTQGETIIAENLKIPAFSHCGVTEDLSPLLTASISGSGNYVKIDAGGWCLPARGTNCSNNGGGPAPKTWTIKPGGDVTAVTNEPFILKTSAGAEMTCESSTMRFHLDAGHWRARFRLAKVRMSFENCELKAADGAVYKAKVTQQGDLWLSGRTASEDGADLYMTNVIINAATEVNGNPCAVRFTGTRFVNFFDQVEGSGSFEADYDNATGVMTAKVPNALITSPNTTCSFPGINKLSRLVPGEQDFVFQPRQSFTTP